MGGSVGREFRPSQTAAGRAQVSRSVGSPESGRAVWAADERVGRSATERAWRGGRSEISRKLHKKRLDFIQQMPTRTGHYSHAKKQKQELLNLELGAALSSNRIAASRGAGSSWVGRSGRAESGRTAAPPAGRVGRSGRPDPKFASPRYARRSVGRGVPSRKRYLRLLVSRSGMTQS